MSKVERGSKMGTTLAQAGLVAHVVVDAIKEHCERIEIAGSIRRSRPRVRDIDIVLIPKHDSMAKIKEICLAYHPLFTAEECKPPKWGGAAASFSFKGIIRVDLYFATRATWPVTLLIRTGSKEHNIYMCSLAREKGMYLAADGSGLFKTRLKTDMLRVDDEADVFRQLGEKFRTPEEREA